MWVSFKALTDATSKFARNGNQQRNGIYRICLGGMDYTNSGWLNPTCIVHHATYKRELYSVPGRWRLSAFGFAVQQMMVNHSIAEITSMIGKTLYSYQLCRKRIFLMDNWAGICTKASQEKLSVIANVAAQKAAANDWYRPPKGRSGNN